MAALLQASTVLRTKPRDQWLSTPLHLTAVLSFGNSLGKQFPWHVKPWVTTRRTSGRPGIARANRNADTIVEKTCQVGDHMLDSVSNYILRQIQKPLAKYIPADWDPLHFLPVNIQSNLQKTEAIATLLLRETIVFAAFFLVYYKVGTFCRSLYGLFTKEQRRGQKIDDAAYEASPFRAAQSPVQGLVMIWASTRLLWVMSIVCKMQAVITEELVYDIRGSAFICTITWFLFCWKRQYFDNLVKHMPIDDTRRVLVVDKVLSLAMYTLAASVIAEVLGLKLGSLLAVGGISGIAVGLAAKEVVSNMFGGASIFITRPFVIGEKIKAGKVQGHVEDIGFLQTKVQGFDGVPVLVPNQAFTSKVITNFSRAKTKVLEATFQLNNRHIFLVHNITLKVREYLSSLPSVEGTPACYLKNMESDGPEIALSCAIKTTGSDVFYIVQQEILIHVAGIITDILGADSPFTPLLVPNST